MFNKFRNSRLARVILFYLLISFISELFFPSVALALTGGPSQPEVQSFEPIGTTEMVDPFSGDFNYNIPLMDVGGYPINLSYHSGVSMDQEASWVGLGWNVNPGVINRNMRGIPDDFNGDPIQKSFNVKPNKSWGVMGGVGAEIFGIDGFGIAFGLGVSYNNYKGYGFEQSVGVTFSAADKVKGRNSGYLGVSSSSDGTISPSLSFSHRAYEPEGANNKSGLRIGASFNGRSGLKTLSIGVKGLHMAGSKTINLGTAVPTYFPEIGLPQVNTSVSLSLKAGGTFFGFDGTANLSGYYSAQRLETKSDQVPAYGYLNLEKGTNQSKVALDFNREKDIPFTINTPSLPVTNLTYDVYSVSAQGIGGSFRPHRNDIPYVYDNRVGSTSDSYSLGFEIGGGNLAKGGIDVTVNDLISASGQWADQNNAIASLKAIQANHTSSNSLAELTYFKQMGEKSVDPDFANYTALGGNKALKIALSDNGGMNVSANASYTDESGGAVSIPSTFKPSRQKRNQLMSFLTKSEAGTAGINKGFYAGSSAIISSSAKDYHIAEMTSLKPDGTRYVYGIPAYNTLQEETAFAIGTNPESGSAGSTGDCTTGLVSYTSSDNSTGNGKGVNNYYSKTSVPAYAHSYLLTSVLSADYVDLDGNGPSKSDLGTYTKFNYVKNKSGNTLNNANYKWRVPIEASKANFSEGLKSDNTDDQANFLYGEKELWFLESIETKNYIAVFTKEDRKDAYGVISADGGRGGTPSQLLRKISLYSKPDYDANAGNAIPLKEVHFEYDYSLCSNVPNNSGVSELVNGVNINAAKGKLTLKKVYFTYNASQKGRLSPFSFTYSTSNPAYSLKAYDRWGNYKATTLCGGLSNSDFPFVDQDNQATANSNASAWSLTGITLPSGGQIGVTYESDDYAYVQNKQAMQMFKVAGIGSIGGSASLTTNQKIYFKITPISSALGASGAANVLYQNYLSGVSDLYFKCMVDIGAGHNEFVPGYSKIGSYGVQASGGGNYDYGWIILNDVGIKDDNTGTAVNPISKAAWQFGRIHMPSVVWGTTSLADNGVTGVLKAMASSNFASNFANLFRSPNATIKSKGYGSSVSISNSWIRLLSPNKKKLGGGSRVQQIVTTDQWATMATSAVSGSYTQTYDYTTTEGGATISSGVASYEPIIGGEENPFRQPIPFGNAAQNYLSPGEEYYMEEPFGESFFPAPMVGYSKVTVRNILPANVNRHATGYSEYTFYTAKDFPTFAHRTPLTAIPKKSEPIFQLFYSSAEDYMNVSQGFAIETNDMHGKLRTYTIYGQNMSSPVSSAEYTYQLDAGNQNQLDNAITTIKPDGSKATQTVGVDYDLVSDFREESTNATSTSVAGNLAGFLAFIFPIVIPTIFPSVSTETTRFRSATTTKVISRSGILQQVKNTSEGSVVAVQNLAYDAETGQPILTQTINEFNDPLYDLTYPSHWGYNAMGPAYQNIGFTSSSLTFSAGTASLTNASQYFTAGDEVLIGSSNYGWVTGVTSSSLTVLKADGTAFAGSGAVKVVRSGRRNQQSLSMASTSMRTNPLLSSGLNSSPANVVSAMAIEFGEESKVFCDCQVPVNGQGKDVGSTNPVHNPYLTGSKGNWNVQRNYAYMAPRTQTALASGNTNLRGDGVFNTFNAHYTLPAGGSPSWTVNQTGWTQTDVNTTQTPLGFQFESKDVINRYTNSNYGYNNTLPISVSSNARHRDVGFDGFEDYNFNPGCTADHFSFKNSSANVISTEAHSGKRSIKVSAGQTLSVTKVIP